MEVLISNCEDPFVVEAGMVGQWCEAELVKENVMLKPNTEELRIKEDQYEAWSKDGDCWWISDHHISAIRERDEATGVWVEL